MGRNLLRAAGLAGLGLAVLAANAASGQVMISDLAPNNRWFHTPAGDTGTVTLSAPAPSGGVMVVLSSSNPEIVVPSTVTVPAGRTSAAFPIRGASYNSRGEGDVTAMYGGTSKIIHLRVDPGSDVRSVNVDRPVVAGGSSITFRVEIWGAAPLGSTAAAGRNEDVVLDADADVLLGEMPPGFDRPSGRDQSADFMNIVIVRKSKVTA